MKRSRFQDIYVETKFDIKPLGRTAMAEQPSQTSTPVRHHSRPMISLARQPSRSEIAAIIAAASAAVTAAIPTPSTAPLPEEDTKKRKSSKLERKHQTPEEKETKKSTSGKPYTKRRCLARGGKLFHHQQLRRQ